MVSTECTFPTSLFWLEPYVMRVALMQYTARLNAEKVKAFVHSLNEGKIPKKRFNCKCFQCLRFCFMSSAV